MANENFNPEKSTYNIWRADNMEQCLEDDLLTIEGDIEDLETDVWLLNDAKAPVNHTHDGYAATTHGHAQSDVTDLPAAMAAKADLVDGVVPESQLPSYVDDVVEGRLYNDGLFYELVSDETSEAVRIIPESGKVYVDVDTNKSYRWSGSVFAELNGGIALGETAATAHRGDHGAAAYAHSQDGNVHVTAAQKTAWDSKAAGDHNHIVYGGNGASTYKKVWIATDGSDDNDGSSTSYPMATINGAIRKYAHKYKMLDISLEDGTYTENVGAVSPGLISLAIRSNSEDKDGVTLNMGTTLETNVNILRMYNMTIGVTGTGIRPVSVTGGQLFIYNCRVNVPSDSASSCINVYNGCSAFAMNCVLNAGTASTSGAAVYANQAQMVKAINCTSERTVNLGFHAHNGSDISYTDTITATTKTKETYYGKCTAR